MMRGENNPKRYSTSTSARKQQPLAPGTAAAASTANSKKINKTPSVTSNASATTTTTTATASASAKQQPVMTYLQQLYKTKLGADCEIIQQVSPPEDASSSSGSSESTLLSSSSSTAEGKSKKKSPASAPVKSTTPAPPTPTPQAPASIKAHKLILAQIPYFSNLFYPPTSTSSSSTQQQQQPTSTIHLPPQYSFPTLHAIIKHLYQVDPPSTLFGSGKYQDGLESLLNLLELLNFLKGPLDLVEWCVSSILEFSPRWSKTMDVDTLFRCLALLQGLPCFGEGGGLVVADVAGGGRDDGKEEDSTATTTTENPEAMQQVRTAARQWEAVLGLWMFRHIDKVLVHREWTRCLTGGGENAKALCIRWMKAVKGCAWSEVSEKRFVEVVKSGWIKFERKARRAGKAGKEGDGDEEDDDDDEDEGEEGGDDDDDDDDGGDSDGESFNRRRGRGGEELEDDDYDDDEDDDEGDDIGDEEDEGEWEDEGDAEDDEEDEHSRPIHRDTSLIYV